MEFRRAFLWRAVLFNGSTEMDFIKGKGLQSIPLYHTTVYMTYHQFAAHLSHFIFFYYCAAILSWVVWYVSPDLGILVLYLMSIILIVSVSTVLIRCLYIETTINFSEKVDNKYKKQNNGHPGYWLKSYAHWPDNKLIECSRAAFL